MKHILALVSASVMILCCFRSAGQQAGVGFYNVENLYDTIPSLFYDDSDYTPQGKLKWDSGRYTEKLQHVARVIDDMDLDIVGLAEVENEGVVRDLVSALQTDYNYIHITGSDRRGIDLALLYKGDKFVCLQAWLAGSGTSREFLHVQGWLQNRYIHIAVCHMPSRLNSRRYRAKAFASLRDFTVSLLRDDPATQLIIMGDFNTEPSEPLMRRDLTGAVGDIFSPLAAAAARGEGSYAYNDRWMLMDNILLSAGFRTGGVSSTGGIFIKDYMLVRDDTKRRGYPLRTFTSGAYTAGYSDHLPVYVMLDLTAK